MILFNHRERYLESIGGAEAAQCCVSPKTAEQKMACKLDIIFNCEDFCNKFSRIMSSPKILIIFYWTSSHLRFKPSAAFEWLFERFDAQQHA